MDQAELYVSLIDKLIVIEHFDSLAKGRVDHYHDLDTHEYNLRLQLIYRHYQELHNEQYKRIVDDRIKRLKQQNKHFENYDQSKQYCYIDNSGFVWSFNDQAELRAYKRSIRKFEVIN
jgi:hypothetical protein